MCQQAARLGHKATELFVLTTRNESWLPVSIELLFTDLADGILAQYESHLLEESVMRFKGIRSLTTQCQLNTASIGQAPMNYWAHNSFYEIPEWFKFTLYDILVSKVGIQPALPENKHIRFGNRRHLRSGIFQ